MFAYATLWVVMFLLWKWCMLGVSLYLELICLVHWHQSFYGSCDGVHAFANWASVYAFVQRSRSMCIPVVWKKLLCIHCSCMWVPGQAVLPGSDVGGGLSAKVCLYQRFHGIISVPGLVSDIFVGVRCWIDYWLILLFICSMNIIFFFYGHGREILSGFDIESFTGIQLV